MDKQEPYTNFVILLYGRTIGIKLQLIRKENGTYGYDTKYTLVDYVGMFNNYFSIVELNNNCHKSFENIPK